MRKRRKIKYQKQRLHLWTAATKQRAPLKHRSVSTGVHSAASQTILPSCVQDSSTKKLENIIKKTVYFEKYDYNNFNQLSCPFTIKLTSKCTFKEEFRPSLASKHSSIFTVSLCPHSVWYVKQWLWILYRPFTALYRIMPSFFTLNITLSTQCKFQENAYKWNHTFH
jgi:hypothetical protein